MKLKTLLFLLPILALLFVMPVSAQTPDITGTWTGTGSVNSDQGIVNLTVTVVVSSQSGGNFTGTVQIASSDLNPTTAYGRIDSLLSLWQIHATGATDYGMPLRLQGFYTPAVLFVTPASITLDAEYGASWIPGDSQQFDFPLIFHVTLTKS